MVKDGNHERALVSRGGAPHTDDLPKPSMRFRQRAWVTFQRALDPLASPKRLPTKWLH